MTLLPVVAVVGRSPDACYLTATDIAHNLGYRYSPIGTTDPVTAGSQLIDSLHATDSLPEPSPLPELGTHPGIVADYPHSAQVDDIIGSLSRPDVELRAVVVAVEARALLDDFASDIDVHHVRFEHGVPHDDCTPACQCAAGCIEYATHICLVGEKPFEWEMAQALLSHLNPTARIIWNDTESISKTIHGNAPISPELTMPGWVQLLNSSHTPPRTHTRVTSFLYENLRPFHPARLHSAFDRVITSGICGTVIRVAGFVRLASRPGITGLWNNTGLAVSLEPAARDTPDQQLAFGQELGITGVDLHATELRAVLDTATLTDSELLDGVQAWENYTDPFPGWVLGH